MAHYLPIHPENPQARLINQAVAVIREGGVIVYPTDSSYALGCQIGNKAAQDRIRRIRRLDDSHHFTLVCRDLSELSLYARVDNPVFRLLRSFTPGPYTFLLKATHEVPRRLQNPKRKTIGLRVPDHPIALALLTALGEPLMSSTLILPEASEPLADPYEICDLLNPHIDLVIDGGNCGLEPTSVIDLVDEFPVVVRRGKGDTTPFER
ncbi:putative RNA-binding protein YciO [Gammaproteobacteria bacterium]